MKPRCTSTLQDIAGKLCERCNYDEVDPDAEVPDIWVDRFASLCEACAAIGHAMQAKMEAFRD